MISLNPIGVIHTPFTEATGTPIQPPGARDVAGTAELYPDFVPGLRDLGGFSHIILLYHFHRSQGFELTVKPFLDDQAHGLFATRAPKRPNPIGLSVVRLERIEENILHLRDVDILDGTPLIDIKPYVPEFDSPGEVRIGWLARRSQDAQNRRADNRFVE